MASCWRKEKEMNGEEAAKPIAEAWVDKDGHYPWDK
jgi:hypothetical protein